MSIDYLLEGDPEAKITWRDHETTWGGPIYGSRRSIAHLEDTDQAARRRYGSRVAVIQSAYNDTVAASAGTHDYDAVYDVYVPGIDWWVQQHFFRELGWAAWYRYPPSFSHHIHMISLGYTTKVGIYVPGQVEDYYNHAMGLAGQHDSGSDDSWHPTNIDSTIFNYSAWKRENGDDMPYSEAELKRIIKEAVREEAATYRENQRERYQRIREAIRRRADISDAKLDEILNEVEAGDV